MNKNTLFAIALSLAVCVVYFIIFPQKKEPEPQQKPVQQTQQAQPSQTQAPAAISTQSISKVSSNAKPESIKLKTAYYTAVLSNKGARIDSIKYAKRSLELAGVPVHGAKGNLDFAIHFNEKEFLDGNPLQSALWNVKKLSDTQIQFTANALVANNPVLIEKTFTFDKKDPYFDISYKIINTGKNQVIFTNNSIIVSPGDSIGPKMNDYDTNFNMLFSIYGIGDSYEKGDRGKGVFSDATDTKKETKNVNWYGIISRYFALVMIPKDSKASSAIWDSRTEGSYRIGGYIPVDSIAPKSSVVRNFRVCIAEKESDILALADKNITPATDVSKWIEPLRNGIFFCLQWINKLFGNYGISIIILSIITKLIFLPLTIKSTNSMKRMSALQPKIAELKQKFQDSPQKLQQATMELYKKNNVNPMGGCLPLLIQMPFFIALYSALSTSFDLWQAPLGLWIKDLSAPDTIATIAGVNLNILPILMTISTYVQQKMTQMDTGATGSQQMIMKLMPLMFIFFFWSMPSGLTMYWTIQNCLQIGHQLYVNRRENGKNGEAAA